MRGEPPSDDDLTDLALLRLDILATIRLAPDEARDTIQLAYLNPPDLGGNPCRLELPEPLSRFNLDFSPFLGELEQTLQKKDQRGKHVDQGSERAILISVTRESVEEARDSLAELQELARTAGLDVLDSVVQRSRQFNPKYLMGEGKMREVVIRALQRGATLLVFDQELSPAQVRSISAMTELKVIDRSQLILDIFAGRAKSLDGKVQVELAQLKYLLPRLTGHGVQMSRLMGGIGGRGPGETKLEIDRRRIRERIAKLERELAAMAQNRLQRRQKRIKAGVPIISIVGYTNAGKSTLLNSLTQSSVLTEDLLFATLDTSSRRLRFPREREVIITDTVGFIRSLPKALLGAFKATLEELQDADLLLHLVDCANPRFQEQIIQVEGILQELDLANIPQLLVFNKGDRLQELKRVNPLMFMKILHAARRQGAITISATEKKSLEPLLTELANRFWPDEQNCLPPDLLALENDTDSPPETTN